MPGMTGWKAGYFHVVTQDAFRILGRGMRPQARIVGNLQFRVLEVCRRTYRMTREELLLVIPAGSPRKHVSDRQSFAARLTDHGFGCNTFRWTRVMCATPGMNMGVTGIPAPFRRIDPAL